MSSAFVENRIRQFVYAFAFYMATMLLQTANSNVGTLVTLASILVTLLLYLRDTNFLIRKTKTMFFLFIFIMSITFNIVIQGYWASNYMKLVAQIVLCVIIYGAEKLNDKEEKFLRNTFLYSSALYALYVIYVCTTTARGFHGNIVLWGGTPFDPNFIGMPFVASSVICLYIFVQPQILFIKRLQYVVLFIFFAVTVMYTASRGNFIAFIVANLGCIIVFLGNSTLSFSRKVLFTVLIIAIGVVLLSRLELYFSDAWARMLSIGTTGSDNGRFELWNLAIDWWKMHPILGGGLYSNYLVFGHAVHNTYLEVLSETGIFGACIIYGFYLNTIYRTIRYNKVYTCILVGLMIQMFFLDALDNRVVWVIFCWFALLPKMVSGGVNNG